MFHLFKSAVDIHEGLRQFERDAVAMLLDVRAKAEYATGHIPGSHPYRKAAPIPLCGSLHPAPGRQRDASGYPHAHGI